jgi:hypothetical protein
VGVSVDAFRVDGSLVRTPDVVGRWGSRPYYLASDGTYAAAGAAGSSFTFRFRGDTLRWLTILGSDQGEAEVWIDDVLVRTVSNHAWSARRPGDRTFSVNQGVHTVRIVVLGSGPASRDNVSIDGFEVG